MGLRFTVLIIQYACFPHISTMRLYITGKTECMYDTRSCARQSRGCAVNGFNTVTVANMQW